MWAGLRRVWAEGRRRPDCSGGGVPPPCAETEASPLFRVVREQPSPTQERASLGKRAVLWVTQISTFLCCIFTL